ncbi:hypothetical protein P389DRAFT_164678 [Cystobasidium minutum MCA 4210]|uniref:uncharacterized protein n=1 Tax=Cystobasidium minutum MCA 4210 TaxID=1397322 RepID=UPI0034CEDBC1|eukprot:jgi/Rhomi1/164678/fgenesh1_kg.1_\
MFAFEFRGMDGAPCTLVSSRSCRRAGIMCQNHVCLSWTSISLLDKPVEYLDGPLYRVRAVAQRRSGI